MGESSEVMWSTSPTHPTKSHCKEAITSVEDQLLAANGFSPRLIVQSACEGGLIWWIDYSDCVLDFSGQRPQYIDVRLGSTTHARNGTVAKVKQIYTHKNFNLQKIDWDYSLLELTEEISYDDLKQSVELPEQDEITPDNTPCLVTGWGNTQNSTESRELLRGADVPIVNQTKCTDAYKQFGGVTERMICAGLDKGGKDGKLLIRLFRLVNNPQSNFLKLVKAIVVAHWFVAENLSESFPGDMAALNPSSPEFILESLVLAIGSLQWQDFRGCDAVLG